LEAPGRENDNREKKSWLLWETVWGAKYWTSRLVDKVTNETGEVSWRGIMKHLFAVPNIWTSFDNIVPL
jgi:hypothetical protein